MVNSGLQVSADITSAVTSEVSSPNVRITGWLGSVSTNTGNSGVGTLRVVLASDQPVVSIDDNSSSLTVDGTVAVSGVAGEVEVVQPTAADLNMTEASAAAILADTTAIIAQLPATIGQKAKAASFAVTLASDEDALAVTGPLTDTELRATPVPVSGTVAVSTLPDSIDGPGAPVIVSFTSDDVNLAADTANQVVVAAQGADTQIWVYSINLMADVAGTISIQDEDDTAHSGVMPVSAGGGFVLNPSGNFAMPWIKVATNKALEIDTVTCAADGIITWAKVDVS